MNPFKQIIRRLKQPPMIVVELEKLQFNPGDIILVKCNLLWDKEHLDLCQETLQKMIDASEKSIKVIVYDPHLVDFSTIPNHPGNPNAQESEGYADGIFNDT